MNTNEKENENLVLDLHGYHVRDAIPLADQIVRDAWEAGYKSVTLIHGAPDVETREQAHAEDRGSIKVELRDSLSRGRWSSYIQCGESAGHSIHDGAMTVQLRANPAPPTNDLSRRLLPRPMTSKHFKAARAWGTAFRGVDGEHPLLAAAEDQFPDLVRKCRRALTTEKVLAERLEHKRQHNPNYEQSSTYRRMFRNWEKARTKAESTLRDIESLMDEPAGSVKAGICADSLPMTR